MRPYDSGPGAKKPGKGKGKGTEHRRKELHSLYMLLHSERHARSIKKLLKRIKFLQKSQEWCQGDMLSYPHALDTFRRLGKI